jgi:hypothetical protein
MAHITRDSLLTLEAYAKERAQLRAQVMAHKKNRIVHVGSNVTLVFEDEFTIRYQIQEMLRTERIFEEDGIREELDAYNPLVPDGSNWKATMLIEYPEAEERRVMLGKLIGVEDRVWIRVEGHDRVYATADEDLERENAEKTSAVHFLRFELEPAMISGLKKGMSLSVGIDHSEYAATVAPVDSGVAASLAGDLAS